jgi:TRAP-type mannitol/chloroaromatic compound transport system permease small subunit
MTCAMGVGTLTVVVLRYGFDIGAIVVQESVLYLHATSFMLGIAYALKDDAHVRVDILYSRLSPTGKARVNLAGHILFLLPCAVTIGALSLDYVAASWRVLEGSSEVGGIPAIFLLKSLIPVMALTLIAQGLAEIARSVLILKSPAAGQRA